jgi:hypothetical protein
LAILAIRRLPAFLPPTRKIKLNQGKSNQIKAKIRQTNRPPEFRRAPAANFVRPEHAIAL